MDWRWRNSIKIATNQYFQEKIWLIVFEGPADDYGWKWLFSTRCIHWKGPDAWWWEMYHFVIWSCSLVHSEIHKTDGQIKTLVDRMCLVFELVSPQEWSSSWPDFIWSNLLLWSKRLMVVFGWVQSFGISFEIRMSAAEIKLDLKLSSRIETTDLCRSWSVI